MGRAIERSTFDGHYPATPHVYNRIIKMLSQIPFFQHELRRLATIEMGFGMRSDYECRLREEFLAMQHQAWTLIIVGSIIAVIGLFWLVSPSIPWLGKLPGDIVVERSNFRFYFPLASCILLSLLASGILWAFRHLGR